MWGRTRLGGPSIEVTGDIGAFTIAGEGGGLPGGLPPLQRVWLPALVAQVSHPNGGAADDPAAVGTDRSAIVESL